MTAEANLNDLPAVLERLQRTNPDLLRSILTAFVQALMSADADAACGAGRHPLPGPDEPPQRLPAPRVAPGPARSSRRFH